MALCECSTVLLPGLLWLTVSSAACRLALLRRGALFTRVLGADPDEHPDRVIAHPMFGALNWREALLFLRLHDLDHAGQLRKIAERLS